MTLHGYMPEAIAKPIPAGENDPAIDPVGVVLHVAVSRSDSLHDFFDGPSGGVESHFYVRFDGTIEQYRSIFREADAQFDGNSFTHEGRLAGFVSVETAGMGPGTWTGPQLAALRRIILWVHRQRPFPLRVCPAWNAPGVGYHCLFDQWNHNAHSCPGPNRVDQFLAEIEPWLPRALAAPDSRGANVDHAIHDLKRAKGGPGRMAKVAAALRALRSINPFTWKGNR